MRILLLAFITVPIIEIYLLIKVGGIIGAFPTIVLLFFSAIVGAYLLRTQGLATANHVRASLARGELPAIRLVEGAILLVSGVLLLTPGFFTDTIGFLCLIPPVRRHLATWLLSRMVVMQQYTSHTTHQAQTQRRIYEGEYRRDEEH